MPNARHTYARFWKCALQVNPGSYSSQYRGQEQSLDPLAYAYALRDACIEHGVEVVGLADHGNVRDSETLRGVLAAEGIIVFPGFEVTSSEKVHWVCLFSEDTNVSKLDGYLWDVGVRHPEDRTRPLNLTGTHLIEKIESLGGFCYAAHVTHKSGILKNGLHHLWKHPKLQAAQVPGRVDDLPLQFKRIVQNEDNHYRRTRKIALINASDVATAEDVEKAGTSSFIKMTQPCFSSFKMAFKDPQSRVRIEIPDTHYYSQIEEIKIQGGYFDDLSVNISQHMNAIIGGRGTGKSTLLECLRYALDISHKGSDADKQGQQIVDENLGKGGGRVVVRLRSAANHHKHYTVIRRYGEPPRVIDSNGNESHLHPANDLVPRIEIYGQNEIYELARRPEALTHVLDRFQPRRTHELERLDEAYRSLRENGEKLAKAQFHQEQIELRIANVPKLEEQVRQFEEHGLKQKLQIVPLLEKERQLKSRIKEEADRIGTGLERFEEDLPDLVFLSDTALHGLPHANILRNGRTILEEMSQSLRQKVAEFKEIHRSAEIAISEVDKDLRDALQAEDEELKEQFAKLPGIAGRTGKEIGHEYQRIAKEIERVRPARSQLATVRDLVAHLKQDRRNLLGEISDLRSERTRAKQKTVKQLNERLAGKLRIALRPEGLRHDLRNFLQQLEGVGEKRAAWVNDAEGLTVLGIVDAINEGKNSLLQRGWGLTSGVAEILTKMTPSQIHELECIDLEDELVIELNISHTSHANASFRPLNRLSTGQQCTAILHLLLLENQDPLVIDQPEDNLDNAFIAGRIVDELRKAKTERQFLFATHNANIPVFGDAEWIGVCESSNDRAQIAENAQGSIDVPGIRDRVANILEGGKEAFLQRKEKYGFDYDDQDQAIGTDN